MESFSNGYDVLDMDTFRKIWSGKGLGDFITQAITKQNSSSSLDVHSVMEFVVTFTNPR